MNVRTIFSFLSCVCLVALSGCVTHVHNDPNNDPNPVFTSTAYLTWLFPSNSASNNPNCAQTGISQVVVTLDGAPITANCIDGENGAAGWQTPALNVGTHNLDLSAQDNTGYEFYHFTGSLVIADSPASQAFDLQWSVGGTAVAWELRTGGNALLSCGAAGIQDIHIDFEDITTQTSLYGGAGDVHACTAYGATYDFLPAGTYDVFVWGFDPGSVRYAPDVPPRISIQAGVFPGNSNPVLATLYPQH